MSIAVKKFKVVNILLKKSNFKSLLANIRW